MRALVLYLRSRAVPATAAAMLACTAALWALGLAIDDPQGRALTALLAALAATTAIGHGLAGPDPGQDRGNRMAATAGHPHHRGRRRRARSTRRHRARRRTDDPRGPARAQRGRADRTGRAGSRRPRRGTSTTAAGRLDGPRA